MAQGAAGPVRRPVSLAFPRILSYLENPAVSAYQVAGFKFVNVFFCESVHRLVSFTVLTGPAGLPGLGAAINVYRAYPYAR